MRRAAAGRTVAAMAVDASKARCGGARSPCCRRWPSATSGGSGSPTSSPCWATGPAASPSPCWCSTARVRRRGRPRSPPSPWLGFVGIGQVLATLADRYGRVSGDAGGRRGPGGAVLRHAPAAAMSGGCWCWRSSPAWPPRRSRRPARRRCPTSCRRTATASALALAGISVQSSLVRRATPSAVLLLTVVDPEAAIAINACTFLVSARRCCSACGTRRPAQPAEHRSTVSRSLGDGAAALFGDRMVRRALAIVAVTGALGTVGRGAGGALCQARRARRRLLGLLAAAVPVGTLVGTAVHGRRGQGPPHPAAQRGVVRGDHGRRRGALCSGSRLRRSMPSWPSPSPAACSRCPSPPTP